MRIRLVCLVVALVFAIPAAGRDKTENPKRRTDDKVLLSYTPQEDEGFITRADLKALGCDADKNSGMYADIPLSGLRIFQLASKKGCAVSVNTRIVELRYAKDDVAEQWRSIEEKVAKRAKKCGSEAVMTTNRSYGKSLVATISGSGKECGFNYAIEDRGFIYDVNVRGSLAITSDFERLVAAKVDALATGKAGAYDRIR